jgi:hypothetical protein
LRKDSVICKDSGNELAPLAMQSLRSPCFLSAGLGPCFLMTIAPYDVFDRLFDGGTNASSKMNPESTYYRNSYRNESILAFETVLARTKKWKKA